MRLGPTLSWRSALCYRLHMSRSKHQTLKSIMDGQSKVQIDAMFRERDHDAVEWIAKRAIKTSVQHARRAGRAAPGDADGHVNTPDDSFS